MALRLDSIGEADDSAFVADGYESASSIDSAGVRLDRIGDEGLLQALEISEQTGDVHFDDALFILRAQYAPSGSDLSIRGDDGSTIIVRGYFDAAQPPDLVAPGGIRLEGELVAKLAGPRAPGQYAQTGDASALGAPIGEVKTLDGAVTVQHPDGTTETLAIGDPVFANDIVQTSSGATVGIQLADGAVFNLESDTRMVLDELVYVPEGNDNSLLVSLVEGAFTFVSGQVVPDGDMTMRTPVATLGIRGTWGGVTFIAPESQLNVFNYPDPATTEVHTIEVYGVGGQFLGASADAATVMQYNGNTGTFETSTLSPEMQDLAQRLYQNLQSTYGASQSGDTQSNGGNGSTSGFPEFDTGNTGSSGDNDDGSGDDGENSVPTPEGNQNSGLDGGTNVNLPPIVSAIVLANTDEDATIVNEDDGIVVINLLAGQIDPENQPLHVSGVSGSVSDTRTAPPNLPVVFGGSSVSFDPAYFNYLAEGEEAIVLFRYNVVDNVGQAVPNTARVIVEGRNDAPAIVTGAVTGLAEVAESLPADPAANAGDLNAYGTLNFNDADLSDTGHTDSVSVQATGDLEGQFEALDDAGLLNFFSTIVNAPSSTQTAGTIEWDFTAGENVFDYLAAGQSITFTYTIEIADANGGTDEETVVITVEGRNDQPVIAVENDTSSLTEDDVAVDEEEESEIEVLEDQGTIAFTDVDLTNTHTVANAIADDGGDPDIVWSGGATLPTGLAASLAAAFTTNVSASNPSEGDGAGVIDWTFGLDNADVQFLAAGETLVVTYDVAVTDSSGQVSNTEQVTVTITGVNDGVGVTSTPTPTITESFDDSASEQANVLHVRNGSIDFSDVDLNDTHSVNLTPPTNAPLGGELTVALTSDSTGGVTGQYEWEYSIRDRLLDRLGEGEEVFETFGVTTSDGNGGSTNFPRTIRLVGANDAPTFAHSEVETTFDSIATSGSGAQGQQDEYLLDGFRFVGFTPDDDNTQDALGTMGSGSPSGSYPGSASLTNVFSNGYVVFSREDGTPFSLFSIDLSEQNDGQLNGTFTITGTLAGGGQIVETVTKDDVFGFQTVNLEGFKDLDSVRIDGVGYHIDNIVAEVIIPQSGTVGQAVLPGNATEIEINDTLSFTDVDLIDTHSVSSVTFKSTTHSGQIGDMTAVIGADTTGTGTGGEIHWTFTVDGDETIGGIVTEVYTIKLTDGNTGGTITQDVSIVILPVGDAAWSVSDGNATLNGTAGEESLAVINDTGLARLFRVEPGITSGGTVSVFNLAVPAVLLATLTFDQFENLTFQLSDAGDRVEFIGDFTDSGISQTTITVNGGAGDDVVDASQMDSAYPINIVINGNGGEDQLIGGPGDDEIDGGGEFDFLAGGDGVDILKSGSAFPDDQDSEVFFFRDEEAGGASGVNVDVVSGQITDPFGNSETLNGHFNFIGTSFVDTFTSANTVSPSDPGVFVRGLDGADVFTLGVGFDQLLYDLDDDFGAVNGIVANLSNAEWTDYNGTNDIAPFRILDGFQNLDAIVPDGAFSNVDSVRGTPYTDYFLGDEGNNRFQPGVGNDFVDGGLGSDEVDYRRGFDETLLSDLTINLGTGVSTFMYDGASFTQSLTSIEAARGSGGADTLFGSALEDRLRGEGGDDILNGGRSADILEGGAGADTFVLDTLVGVDVIEDYSFAEGDMINLDDLLDAGVTAGNINDYVRAVESGSDTVLQVDSDGAANDESFVDVAILTGIGAGSPIDVIFDGSESTTVSSPT